MSLLSMQFGWQKEVDRANYFLCCYPILPRADAPFCDTRCFGEKKAYFA